MSSKEIEEWIDKEDESCRADRIARLERLVEDTPRGSFWKFDGGLMSKYLFEEARYSFVYGSFLGCILLGLAFIERILGALFYASGTDDFKRAGLMKLLAEAVNQGWMSKDMFKQISKANDLKNAVAHFREPDSKDEIDIRGVHEDMHPYEIIEEDARKVMETVLHTMSIYGTIH